MNFPRLNFRRRRRTLSLRGTESQFSLAPQQIASGVCHTSLRHPSFRGNIVHSHLDNLRNDTKYLTSWTSAGWSEHLPNSLFRIAYHEHIPSQQRHDIREFVSPLAIKLSQHV
jgi:hypothetical protein